MENKNIFQCNIITFPSDGKLIRVAYCTPLWHIRAINSISPGTLLLELFTIQNFR